MEFTGGQWAQLIIALALGVTFFVAAYAGPTRWLVSLMVVLAPFQFIGSRFGTLNMVLIYLIGVAFLLRGRLRQWPFLGYFALIYFAYMVSFSQAMRATWFDHLLYLVGITANLILFYVVYNHSRERGEFEPMVRMFVWMNVLVIGYCVIQLVTGVDRFAFLGIREFSFAEGEVERQRLVGPFGAPGTNGEFFALQILLLGYLMLHDRRTNWRMILLSLMLANFGFLVMTGSRGSFLAFMGGCVLFAWFFRRQLGFGRMLRVGIVSLGLFTVMSAVVINYSQYNVLFDRLMGTELRGGLPDTRAKAFTIAWERIPEKIMLGHGPRLRLINEYQRQIRGYEGIPYPHNLYLFLLFTVGLVGLTAYLLFFLAMYRWWRRADGRRSGNALLDGLPRLGMLLLIVFLVDQLKIEFLRARLSDHQQYLFSLWAMLLAFTAPRERPRGPRPDDEAAKSVV